MRMDHLEWGMLSKYRKDSILLKKVAINKILGGLNFLRNSFVAFPSLRSGPAGSSVVSSHNFMWFAILGQPSSKVCGRASLAALGPCGDFWGMFSKFHVICDFGTTLKIEPWRTSMIRNCGVAILERWRTSVICNFGVAILEPWRTSAGFRT